jgi:thioredoxin 1
MAKPVEVTDANFDEVLRNHPLVLVDFWAEWCAPCRMIAPILEELAQEYEGKLLVAKLDVDENPKTAMRYRVMSIPTVILFKNGQPVEVLVGAQPKRNFQVKLEKHLPPSA